ncbi:MAG: methyltransferase domain-containing protein [Kibdelosporangium sp.]
MSVDLVATLPRPVPLAEVVDLARTTLAELLALDAPPDLAVIDADESVPGAQVYVQVTMGEDSARLMDGEYHPDGDDGMVLSVSPSRTCAGVVLATSLALAAALASGGEFIDDEIGMLRPPARDPRTAIARSRLTTPSSDLVAASEVYMRQFPHLRGWPEHEIDATTRAQLRLIHRVLAAVDVPVWLFGGWGLDARIGRITRRHGDVEFWVASEHAARSKAALLAAGATALATQPPEEACEFVWDDVEFSTAYFDRRADGTFAQVRGRWSDWSFPADSFGPDNGRLDGIPVPAMSVAGMLAMKEQFPALRNGRPWRDKDISDIAVLTEMLTSGNQRAWEAASQKHEREYGQLLAEAAAGTSLLPRERHLLRDILQRAPEVVHPQSGHGLDDVALIRAGAASVIGVDFSSVAVGAAQRRADELGVACRYVVAQLPGMPLPDSSADLVYTGKGALIWMNDLRAWARDIVRVLRPGGHLFIYEAHPAVPLWTWDTDRPRIRPDRGYFAPSHVNDTFPGHGAVEWQWTLGQIVTTLVESGLRILNLTEYPEPFWRPDVAAAAWDGRLPNSFALLAQDQRESR